MARFVNEYVIAPSFARLNERWGISNTLKEDAQALKAAIRSVETAPESPTLKRALEPGQVELLKVKTDSLEELRRKVDAALTAVEDLRFDAPEGDEWWRSVQRKEGERLEIAGGAKEKVGDIRSLQASRMEKVIAELRRVAKRQQDATQRLSEDLQQLEEQLKQGATELAGMGMGWIPIGGDLKGFLRHFPLLVGVLLPVFVAWPTYRRVSLVRAIRLHLPEDTNDDSQRVLWQEYGPPASTMEWSLLAGALVGYEWIGLATAGITGTPLEGALGAVSAGVGGAGPFTIALAYRVSARRRAQRVEATRRGPLIARRCDLAGACPEETQNCKVRRKNVKKAGPWGSRKDDDPGEQRIRLLSVRGVVIPHRGYFPWRKGARKPDVVAPLSTDRRGPAMDFETQIDPIVTDEGRKTRFSSPTDEVSALGRNVAVPKAPSTQMGPDLTDG